ncbi:MAG: hypothetical protein H0X65_10470 [Gemmatimonadetes bacterium]|nr:hypothetical protein [Gemmatimonadota bacterium]
MVLCAVGLTACERAPLATAFEDDPVALSTTGSGGVAVSNLRVASGKSYKAVQNGTLGGAVRMTDRSFTLSSSIPNEVQGLTLIRTANDDKNASPGSTSFFSFDVDRDVTIYVAHDNRVPRPSWLSGFANTGLNLVDTDGQSRGFRLFKKNFSKGRVTLGSNVATTVSDASMYSVLVKPRETSTGTTAEVTVANLRVASGKSYHTVQNGTLGGAVRMTDRSYTLSSSIPNEVQGLTLIRTANDDKNASPGSTSFLSFDVDRDVTIYVAHDNRVPRPSWLSGFANTGLNLVDTDGQSRGFRLFKKNFSKGRITLGSNVSTTVSDASMYSVLVKPREVSTGTTPPVNSVTECASPRREWIWCDDFEQDRLAGYFEHNARNGGFVRAAGVGRDGSQGMRARWQAGQQEAGSLKLAFGKTPHRYFRPVDAGTTKYRTIYWRMYVRTGPGWTGGGGFKLSRATSMVSSSWSQAMIAHVWTGGRANEYLLIDPASGTDTRGRLTTTKYNDFSNLRWLGKAKGNTLLFSGDNLGKWHCVEAHTRLNDSGQSNGEFRMWINGSLDAERTGLNWVGSYSDYGINAVFFENYWNGGAPKAQERYFDNLVVSTKRIGC